MCYHPALFVIGNPLRRPSMSRPTRPRHVRERQPSGGAWERAEEFQSGEHLPGPPRTKPTACSPGRVPGDCGAAGLGWGRRSTRRALHGTPVNRAVTHSPVSLGAKPWVGLPRSSAACLLRWHPDLRPSPPAPPLRSRLQTTLNAWTSLQEACSPPRA